MTIFACLSCVILVTKVLWTRRQYNVILYILNFKLCKSSGLTFLTILEKSGPLILFFKKVGKCHNFAENFMNCKILKRASSIQHCKKKKWSFTLRIFSVNVTKSAETANLIIFTEETLNGKLYFLCSGVCWICLFLL